MGEPAEEALWSGVNVSIQHGSAERRETRRGGGDGVDNFHGHPTHKDQCSNGLRR